MANDISVTVEEITRLVMEEFQELSKNPYMVPVGISARHIHLQRDHVEALFGPGYQLTPRSYLSQTGQFACEEFVDVVGPKGKPVRLRILGPERKQTQIEVARADARNLGVVAPIRTSGDLKGTPGATLRGPKGEIIINEGVIVADRHVHMTPADAAWFGVRDGEKVSVRIGGDKAGIMENVVIRVTDKSRLDFHIDTDDANAFALTQGQKVEIIR